MSFLMRLPSFMSTWCSGPLVPSLCWGAALPLAGMEAPSWEPS